VWRVLYRGNAAKSHSRRAVCGSYAAGIWSNQVCAMTYILFFKVIAFRQRARIGDTWQLASKMLNCKSRAKILL